MGVEALAAADLLTRTSAELSAALGMMAASAAAIDRAASVMVGTLGSGGSVLAAGNGGSAAEAQHFVAELMGRFKITREAYSVVALTTDSAVLTAVANDFGYQEVFSRQVQGLARPGDTVILFSTSGESENVVRAAQAARAAGADVIAVTSHRSCRLSELADVVIGAPGTEAGRIQEVHMAVTHILCELVEAGLSRPAGPQTENGPGDGALTGPMKPRRSNR